MASLVAFPCLGCGHVSSPYLPSLKAQTRRGFGYENACRQTRNRVSSFHAPRSANKKRLSDSLEVGNKQEVICSGGNLGMQRQMGEAQLFADDRVARGEGTGTATTSLPSTRDGSQDVNALILALVAGAFLDLSSASHVAALEMAPAMQRSPVEQTQLSLAAERDVTTSGLAASSLAAPSLFDLAAVGEERGVLPDNTRPALEKLSLSLLFGTMLAYWVQGIFNLDSKFQNVGLAGSLLSNAALAWLLVDRWIVSGHFPVSNMYESLMFLAWCVTAVSMTVEKGAGSPEVGRVTSPLSLLIAAGATLSLPPSLQSAGALVPALQSNWLVMHVSVMILSYAALLTGSTLAIAYLFFSYTAPDDKEGKAGTSIPGPPLPSRTGRRPVLDLNSVDGALRSAPASNGSSIGSYAGGDSQLSAGALRMQSTMIATASNGSLTASRPALTELRGSAEEMEGAFLASPSSNATQLEKRLSTLDNLSYRSVGIGFPLLTIGILSGAVWANEAWGAVWSWDPKETWALITWLIYAVYLHTRLIKGWEGRSSAWVATIGFAMVWLCYLGVNLLGVGLHSYGWLANK